MKRNDLKIGDKIWVYNYTTSPIETIVTRIEPAWIEYKDIFHESESVPAIYFNVYKRPEEKGRLMEEIEKDIYHLQYILDLFRNCEGE